MANAPRWPGTPISASSRTFPSISVTRKAPGSAAPTRTTRGLLRQCFPKGTDLSLHGPGEFGAVAAAVEDGELDGQLVDDPTLHSCLVVPLHLVVLRPVGIVVPQDRHRAGDAEQRGEEAGSTEPPVDEYHVGVEEVIAVPYVKGIAVEARPCAVARRMAPPANFLATITPRKRALAPGRNEGFKKRAKPF